MCLQIISDKEGKDAAFVKQRYAEICDVLIDSLIDEQDLSGFVRLNFMLEH